MRAALLVLFACSLSGCASSTRPPPKPPPTPPPEREFGGARLHLEEADWERADHRTRIEIRPNGGVYRGDDLVFRIEAEGRIYYPSGVPFAVLSERGIVAGPNNEQGGRVGLHNATPGKPREHQAWLTVASDGNVTFYRYDGERKDAGQWHGCEGPMLRTCTLVTHAIMLDGNFGSSTPWRGGGGSGGDPIGQLLLALVLSLAS